MSTTVTYKGSTITTVNNNTKTLTTAGKYLEANVILTDITGQSGSSGYTRTVVAPQQTVTPDSNRRATLSDVTVGFIDASHYIVTLDGVEWFCTCETLWGTNLTVGEVQWFFTTGLDHVYPFGAIYVSGESLTVAFENTSQHTVKIEKLELTGSGSGSTSWETVYSDEVTVNWEGWSDNPNNNCYYVMIPWTEPINYGSVWRITWDGTLYECTATLAGSSDGTPYILGNNTYNDSEGGNNEPFMLQRYNSNLAIVSPDYGTHTILIEKQVTSSNATLVTKTITLNGTYDAEDDSADGYSSVTVNVSSGAYPDAEGSYITLSSQN